LNYLSKIADGAAEFIWDLSLDSLVREKVIRQLSRAIQPRLQEVDISWGALRSRYEIIQAPDPMPSFFSGDLVLAYGLLKERPNPGRYTVELTAEWQPPALKGQLSDDAKIEVEFEKAEVNTKLVVAFPDDEDEEDEEIDEPVPVPAAAEGAAADAQAVAAQPAVKPTRPVKPYVQPVIEDISIHMLAIVERIMDMSDDDEEGFFVLLDQ